MDILESYELLCRGIVKALEHLGIEGEFKPINDVNAGGKKISGNAMTRRHGCVLQHGTTLLDLDVTLMFSILKVPLEKISDKMISDVKERVTSIRDLLNRDVQITELRDALKIGFSEALDIKYVEGSVEKSRIQFLSSPKRNIRQINGISRGRYDAQFKLQDPRRKTCQG
jgi:lipoate-protein ligase A